MVTLVLQPVDFTSFAGLGHQLHISIATENRLRAHPWTCPLFPLGRLRGWELLSRIRH